MRSGFTLVEVVAVIVVMFATLLVVAPAFAPVVEPGPAYAAAADLSDRLDALRRSTRRSGVATVLVLDPRDAHYWEFDAAGSGLRLTGEGDIRTQPGVRWTGRSSSRIHFRFDAGGTTVGDSLEVSDASETVALHIDRLTGEVRIVAR